MGNIDYAGGEVTQGSSFPHGESFFVSGWAADWEDYAPVTRVAIRVDGLDFADATLRDERPDVAQALQDSRFTNSGWHFSGSSFTLSVGTHTIDAVAYDSAGATTVLATRQITVLNTAPLGSAEYIGGEVTYGATFPQGDRLYVGGWAADREMGAPVSRVSITVDGNPIADAHLGEPRPDVAAAWPSYNFLNSGFSYLHSGSLPAGTHTVAAIAYDQQNAATTLQAVTVNVVYPTTTLSPMELSLVVGDTYTLDAFASDGSILHGLPWSSSDLSVVGLSTDDPPILTAKPTDTVKTVTITAGSATATVTVYPGPTLPVGTVKWKVPQPANTTRNQDRSSRSLRDGRRGRIFGYGQPSGAGDHAGRPYCLDRTSEWHYRRRLSRWIHRYGQQFRSEV